MFKKHEYVYAVYKTGNFTKAAQSLFISQPSLSVAIQNVEKQLGAPLFIRSGSKAILTEVGKEYISATEKIMNIQKDFENKINDIYNLEAGEITVGGTNYLSSYVLPKVINKFSALYPKINVNLVEANSKSLSEMMLNETVDVIVDSFDESMDKYVGHPLKNEQIFLCVPRDFKINQKLSEYKILPHQIYENTIDIDSVKPVDMAFFKNEPFILLKNGNDMFYRAQVIFEKAKITPNVLLRVDQMNISYSLADSGMGCCFLTDTLFKFGKFSDSVVLYKVSKQHSTRTLYIAHKKNRYIKKSSEKFMLLAKEIIK